MKRDRSHSGAVVLMGMFIVLLAVLAHLKIPGGRLHPVSVITSSGSHRFWVEYAKTPSERQKGLMNRESLSENQGMLFLFDSPSLLTFWMKNTLIPLDMLFVDEEFKIQNIAESAQPCLAQAEQCPYYFSSAPAQYVLEIPGGMAKKLQISAGDKLKVPTLPR